MSMRGERPEPAQVRPLGSQYIAVEKEPPWELAVYELDPEALEQGRREHETQMARYAEGLRTGVWEGYPARVRPISLPRYAIREDTDDDSA